MTTPNTDPQQLEALQADITHLASTEHYQSLARQELARDEAVGADKAAINAVARGIVGYEVRVYAGIAE